MTAAEFIIGEVKIDNLGEIMKFSKALGLM
jgi:hypothetical protein